MPDKPVKVRIAPSPTGPPHVGTAYVALFNYVFAKQNNGKFVLRIEDTDQTRSTKESELAIYESLRWLGLQWDEGPDIGGDCGPYRQSERAEIHQEYARKLIEMGAAYYCFCTPERLEKMRALQRAAKKPSKYDRHCLKLSEEEIKQKLANGEKAVIRLKMPSEGITIINDYLRGEISFENQKIDDQILLKSDGFPTYHLANVVDDHLMGITHVMRAEEWIPSTPKHIVMYNAFGWEPPVFCHLPLLRNKDKSKISKRKNPTSLTYYQRAGYLPETLLNFLALNGWTMPDSTQEKFTLDEMISNFKLDRISLGGPVFDLDKLRWLNGLYMRKFLYKELRKRIMEHNYDEKYVEKKIVPLIQERIETLEDFAEQTVFFFSEPKTYDDKLVPKKHTPAETRKVLKKLLERLDTLREWNKDTIGQLLYDYTKEIGWKTGHLFMTLRITFTGRKASTPLFETLEVLGPDICRHRLQKILDVLRSMK